VKFQKEKKWKTVLKMLFPNVEDKYILVLFCFKLLLNFFLFLTFLDPVTRGYRQGEPRPETNGGLIIICCATAPLS